MSHFSIAALSLLLMTAFNNCGDVAFNQTSAVSQASLGDRFGVCNIDVPCVIPCIGGACDDDGDHVGDGDDNGGGTSKSYNAQVPAAINKVDILFVIDNSRSMKNELLSLSTKFQSLTQALSGRDWQACLLTTDYENEKGAPRAWSNGQYILSTGTQNPQGVFEASLASIVPENDPTNFEQGIRSVGALIENADDQDSKGCLRADAGKAIVFVSDEDELGDGWVLGDKSALQPTADNHPQSLLNKYAARFSLPLTIHAVVIEPGDEQCLTAQRSEGGFYESTMGYAAVRYSELVERTSGVSVSICSNDYSQPLAKIGSNISDSLDSVELACSKGVVVDRVEVTGKIQGQRSYDVVGNRVVFNPVLISGETVKIEYTCFE